MSGSFSVYSVVVCDYVTQDQGGKSIQIGITHEELRFTNDVKVLPPLFIAIAIKPLSTNINYFVDFDTPDGKRIIRFTGRFGVKSKLPEYHILQVNIQTPPLPFPGQGQYMIRVRDENMKVVYARPLHVVIGPRENVEFDFDGNIEVGEDYLNSTES